LSARLAIPVLMLGCLAVALVTLAVGPSGWRSPVPWRWDEVMMELRAPRVLLAGVVGASLAVAGAAMQVLLQNELADPYILGLSGGASAGAVASLALWPGLPPGPAAAAGAAGAATVVRALARGPYDPTRLLLAGVAVGSLLASATGLIVVLAPADRLLRSATFWLFGGFGTPRWSTLVLPALLLAVVLAWMLVRAERLDRLTLGQDVAASLGVDVARLRRGVLLASVALTATAVAASGLVGFVGLVAPHAARRWVGAPHRRLLPVVALGGAILVMAADAAARTAFAPREVPVGLLTAAVGGPFFLWQLQRGAR
jgi:iron complex transport system permease protein